MDNNINNDWIKYIETSIVLGRFEINFTVKYLKWLDKQCKLIFINYFISTYIAKKYIAADC